MFAIAFAVSLWPLTPLHEVSWFGAVIKATMAGALLIMLSVVGYGSPTFLWREVVALRARLGGGDARSHDRHA